MIDVFYDGEMWWTLDGWILGRAQGILLTEEDLIKATDHFNFSGTSAREMEIQQVDKEPYWRKTFLDSRRDYK
jgi:hypothetical protein